MNYLHYHLIRLPIRAKKWFRKKTQWYREMRTKKHHDNPLSKKCCALLTMYELGYRPMPDDTADECIIESNSQFHGFACYCGRFQNGIDHRLAPLKEVDNIDEKSNNSDLPF